MLLKIVAYLPDANLFQNKNQNYYLLESLVYFDLDFDFASVCLSLYYIFFFFPYIINGGF